MFIRTTGIGVFIWLENTSAVFRFETMPLALLPVRCIVPIALEIASFGVRKVIALNSSRLFVTGFYIALLLLSVPLFSTVLVGTGFPVTGVSKFGFTSAGYEEVCFPLVLEAFHSSTGCLSVQRG